MKTPPVVDRLDTRLLEGARVTRTYVRECAIAEASDTHLLLTTRAQVAPRFVYPQDRGTIAERLPHDAQIDGRVRLDFLAGGAVRVRYAEGDAVPDHRTPMLVGTLEPAPCRRPTTADDRIVYAHGGQRIEIGLQPFTIRVTSGSGAARCLVGGRDKNYYNGTGLRWDSYNTGISRTLASGRPLATEVFALWPDEAVYGFGETFLGLDKVGQTLDLVVTEALGVTTPRSYKTVPFFMTTRGYGVFLHHAARMTCWVGSLSAADVQVAVEDDFLDYFLLFGTLEEILARYADLTGRSRVPPAWSFGYWQSKISYASAGEALTVVRGMRAADVPMDVLHLDTFWFREDWRCDLEFDPARFPDPAGFVRELAGLGVKVSVWQLPYIPEGSRLFDELAAAGAFVRTTDGEIYDVGICMTPGFDGVVGCIDWTHPAAREVYGRHLRRLFDAGVRCIKVDFGEQAPLDGVYHDGTPGHRMHNLYPLLYNEAIAETTEAATGEHVIWARSAWAGSQRHPLHWGGDSSANWHNLGPQLAGGLSFGLSGFAFWSQDIGGFLGQPDGALLVRWMQAGLFLSHARIHGMGERELYRFDAETLRICRDYVRLRYRLLPYLLASARDAVARSVPMARALVLAWEDDPTTWGIADQWLLGNDLLVAPILDERGVRRVYLPAGVWTDWWSGERRSGRRWITVTADLEILPLYVREGGLVPLGPDVRFVGERPTDAITLRLAPFARRGESRLVIPVDDERVTVHYVADGAGHTVAIGPSRATFAVEVLGAPAPPVRVVRS